MRISLLGMKLCCVITPLGRPGMCNIGKAPKFHVDRIFQQYIIERRLPLAAKRVPELCTPQQTLEDYPELELVWFVLRDDQKKDQEENNFGFSPIIAWNILHAKVHYIHKIVMPGRRDVFAVIDLLPLLINRDQLGEEAKQLFYASLNNWLGWAASGEYKTRPRRQ